MRSLAEGVETKRHALALARSGCDEAQGYFFSRPIDQNAFLAYAGNNPSREISRYFNLNKV
jgi:EAL domain-containing protein (putative c-di-GMP-specific phosphodiesterase class I)